MLCWTLNYHWIRARTKILRTSDSKHFNVFGTRKNCTTSSQSCGDHLQCVERKPLAKCKCETKLSLCHFFFFFLFARAGKWKERNFVTVISNQAVSQLNEHNFLKQIRSSDFGLRTVIYFHVNLSTHYCFEFHSFFKVLKNRAGP